MRIANRLIATMACAVLSMAAYAQTTKESPAANAPASEPVAVPAVEPAATAPAATAETSENPSPAAAPAAGSDPATVAMRDIRQSNYLPFPVPQVAAAMLPGESGWRPNTVSAPFPHEIKTAMAQAGMAASPWSMRQMFNFMSTKMKAKPGLTFEQIVEAMDSRAIEVNFKKVGFTHISKEVGAKTGKPTPAMAILHYCDAMVGRKIMDYAPEFSIFLPCRVSVIEDADGAFWLMTMDWDVTWLNYAWHPDTQIDAQLKQDAVRIRDALHSIMTAGATGDW